MLPGHDPNWKELNCTDALLLKGKTFGKKKKRVNNASNVN